MTIQCVGTQLTSCLTNDWYHSITYKSDISLGKSLEDSTWSLECRITTPPLCLTQASVLTQKRQSGGEREGKREWGEGEREGKKRVGRGEKRAKEAGRGEEEKKGEEERGGKRGVVEKRHTHRLSHTHRFLHTHID